MKYLQLVMIFIGSFCYKASSQTLSYKYDKSDRLIQVLYPNNLAIDYAYDKDGNRISQITSTVIATAVSNLSDSLYLIQHGVIIYPNPNNGDFRGKVYITKPQNIIIKIISANGQLIHTYNANVIKGFYDFIININPKPTGTYIVNVEGQTIHTSKTFIITN